MVGTQAGDVVSAVIARWWRRKDWTAPKAHATENETSVWSLCGLEMYLPGRFPEARPMMVSPDKVEEWREEESVCPICELGVHVLGVQSSTRIVTRLLEKEHKKHKTTKHRLDAMTDACEKHKATKEKAKELVEALRLDVKSIQAEHEATKAKLAAAEEELRRAHAVLFGHPIVEPKPAMTTAQAIEARVESLVGIPGEPVPEAVKEEIFEGVTKDYAAWVRRTVEEAGADTKVVAVTTTGEGREEVRICQVQISPEEVREAHAISPSPCCRFHATGGAGRHTCSTDPFVGGPECFGGSDYFGGEEECDG